MKIVILIIVMIIGLIPCGIYLLIKKETKNDMISRRFQRYAVRAIISNVIVLILFFSLDDLQVRLIILLILLHIINTIFFRSDK